MDIDRIIPRTWDWLYFHFADMVLWYQTYPERGLLLVVSVGMAVVAMYLLLTVMMLRRQWLLRGSKMPKKQRNKWVRRYTLERWIASTERDIALGKITESEGTAMIRWLKEAAGPTTFIEKPKTAKLESELPLKERLELLKKRIQRRISFRGRSVLYKRVKLPGPPVPKQQAVVKPKKGEMFSRKRAVA